MKAFIAYYRKSSLNKQLLTTCCFLLALLSSHSYANNYERDKAVPVEKVLFGKVVSVRNISQEELIEDKNNGWKTFGGALIGGVIGNQFGGGSGRDIATILGTVIGGSIAHNQQNQQHIKVTHLVELMIEVNGTMQTGEQFMVIQDYDDQMVFHTDDPVRMVYLTNGRVRIDKQM
ncbi:glycine zipper 2TM domain-containing protein [Colwellia asteriadis]|uniref:Glycine zipper 2TM domain-containing protein n=1 Tax=Colwellia asteriadis TaxID=517723 RepID=A0ABP3WL05_9GAMM